MHRKNPFRFLAAVLGISAAAPAVTTPAPVAQQVQPAVPGGQRAPAQSTRVGRTRAPRLAEIIAPFTLSRQGGTVWQANPKRGNRRNRSRWDYRR